METPSMKTMKKIFLMRLFPVLSVLAICCIPAQTSKAQRSPAQSQTPSVDCSRLPADEMEKLMVDIQKAVTEKLSADARFKDQMTHILVRHKDKELFLFGYIINPAGQTNSLADIKAAVEIARNIAKDKAPRCVKLRSYLVPRKPHGCGNRMVDCNGTCVNAGMC